MNHCPNCRHGLESCQCKQDISFGIEEAINTLRVADLQVKLLKQDKKELVEAIMGLLATCPVLPDSDDRYYVAYTHAKDMIHKYKS
jgi:hypothetical protein